MTQKNKKGRTTVALEDEVAESLRKLKVHPNQSYSEIIKQIINKEGKDGN